MSQQSQERRKGTQPSGENNKKWQLFLWIDRYFVERRQQLSVGALGTRGVRVEQVPPFERIRQHPESTFPSAVEQIQRPINRLPMGQVKKRVSDGFRVAPFQHVLWGQNQRLHF